MKRSFLFFGFALMGLLVGSVSAIAQTGERSNTAPVENKNSGESQKKPVAKQAKLSSVDSQGKSAVAPVSTVNSNKEAAPAEPQQPASKQPVSTSERNSAKPATAKPSK